MSDHPRTPSAGSHALVRRVTPREVPPPPETWPIIAHEPEHIPDVPPDPNVQRWHGSDVEAVSSAWEAAQGCDSIATIERVYEQTPGGAYICMTPGCSFARRDPERLWRHIHTAHGRRDLPPDDFDAGPWL